MQLPNPSIKPTPLRPHELEEPTQVLIRSRKYLPTYAELIDRLSICILKSIFIPANKEAYTNEIADICADIDSITTEKDVKATASLIKAVLVTMLANRYIWENESKVRETGNQDVALLKLTHSVNGVRNTAKNVISSELGERKDLKVDCLAAELVSDFQNWDKLF